ncbi:hypothetical protein L596_006852 [Steinernema carpocapsae]|uniref:Uncharacterized protein n=1 Tax=Steinernema carpocapsae TaxID=34508 RepID=A0A4U5P7S9_STECR|nr:hypothetical protein L596_006852 [Steinernema carpocapsae]
MASSVCGSSAPCFPLLFPSIKTCVISLQFLNLSIYLRSRVSGPKHPHHLIHRSPRPESISPSRNQMAFPDSSLPVTP